MMRSSVLVLVGLAACTPEPPESAQPELAVLEEDDALIIVESGIGLTTHSPDGRVVVRQGPPGAPDNCSTREIVARLRSVFDDISAERDSIAAKNFASADDIPPLMWYSMADVEGRETFVGRSLDEIDAYFVGRKGHGERISLAAVQINRWDQDMAHLGPLVVVRSANDLPSGRHLIVGKAAFRCHDGKFVVLNLGAYQATLE